MAALNGDGLLPEGVHELPLEDVEELFGRFQRSDRRVKLLESLKEYLSEAQQMDGFVCMIVDGSFVTAKEEPSDIDLILVLRGDKVMDQDWRPSEYNVISRKRVRRRFGFDVAIVRDESDELRRWIDYFVQVKGRPGAKKGLVRVRP